MGLRAVVHLAVLLAVAFVAIGLYGGTDLGETTITVRAAGLRQHTKSGAWYSQIRGELPNRQLVQFTAAHTPPPKEGERIVVRVRRSYLGFLTFTWQAGVAPPPEPEPPGLR